MLSFPFPLGTAPKTKLRHSITTAGLEPKGQLKGLLEFF